MDDLTLREKLDAIEACEKLMARYQKSATKSIKEMDEYEDEETVGYDFASIDHDKYEYFKNLRSKLLDSIEMDPIMSRASENLRSYFK